VKWVDAARAAFSLKHRRIQLLEAEHEARPAVNLKPSSRYAPPFPLTVRPSTQRRRRDTWAAATISSAGRLKLGGATSCHG
jgi:hypothetical protein